jgi:hypothetical protein
MEWAAGVGKRGGPKGERNGAYRTGRYTAEATSFAGHEAEIEGLPADADAPPVVRLHPNMAEVYRLKMAELEIALNYDSIKAEAGEILRSLIRRIDVIIRVDRDPAPAAG